MSPGRKNASVSQTYVDDLGRLIEVVYDAKLERDHVAWLKRAGEKVLKDSVTAGDIEKYCPLFDMRMQKENKSRPY